MRWKWFLIIALVLIVGLIVTVYAILSIYDFNSLKPTIAQAVKGATGRELRIGGDIELKIGLTPALVVEEVSLQNAPWGSRPEMAKIRAFEVQIDLLPLISGNLKVKRLILIEPDILIETDRSGKSNLEFQTAKRAEAAEPKRKAPAKGKRLLPLTFNRVGIEKGHLTYKEGQSGKSYAVTFDILTAEAEGYDSPIKLELKGAYNGRSFEIIGTLGTLLALTDPNKSWPLNLTAKAGGANIIVEGRIRDVMNARGISLNVTAQGESIPDIARLAGLTDVPDMGPFNAAVKVANPDGRWTIERLDLNVGTEELAKMKLTGSIKDPLAKRGIALRFTVWGRDLANLENLSGQPLPLKGAFEVSGNAVDAAGKTYKVSNLKIALGESDINGSVEIGLARKRPWLKAVLSSQRLDLRTLSSKEVGEGRAQGKSAEQDEKKDKVFPDDPLPLDALKQADAEIKIRASQVLLPRLALNDLTANMVLVDGRLMVKKLQSAIGGGTLHGRLELRPQDKAAVIETALKIEQLDLGRMLKEVEAKDIIEGMIDADIELNGSGGSIAALMAGLNGKIILMIGQGRINNKHINLLGTDISSSLLRLLNPFREEADYTELNCFVSRFDIKDGLAESTALVFDTTLMSIAGEGEVNLKTEELDLSIMPSPKKGVGKLSLSLGELAKSLKMSGTLANPSLAIDPNKTAITLGKAIGGVALFGPAGIVAALAGKSSGDENPCLAAIEAAEKGVRISDGSEPKEKKGAVEKTAEGITEDVKDAIEGVGSALKKLFGK